jgi:putative transposase
LSQLKFRELFDTFRATCSRSSSRCSNRFGKAFAPELRFTRRFSPSATCGWRIVISPKIPQNSPSCYHSLMRNLAVLFIHFIAVLARLLGPGGARSLIAESLLLKHQILILNRSRKRSPNLHVSDRILAGLLAFLVPPTRLLRSAIVLKPSTLLALHKTMSKRKYRMLFSPDRRRQPGPKGPSAELIRAVVEMKQRNPNWGCPRIAQQMALAFHIQIDKDVVRRILARHYRPGQDSDGPSWLTFLGHRKGSLWSVHLFRCASATLRTHWVLLVMDQYTRRILGFGVQAGTLNGVALCKMFNRAIQGQLWMPKYISSDNDPLYRFHQWQANLRILEVSEIKTVPYVPLSHPFVERLNGTIRSEYLDHLLFWTTVDLENKLLEFRTYFNNHRPHTSREGRTPNTPLSRPIANLHSFRWQPHCRALYQTPVAA